MLFKNCSIIMGETMKKITKKLDDNAGWTPGVTRSLCGTYSQILAYKTGEISPNDEDRKQADDKMKELKAFLKDLRLRRRQKSGDIRRKRQAMDFTQKMEVGG